MSPFFTWLLENQESLPKKFSDIFLDVNELPFAINGSGEVEELVYGKNVEEVDIDYALSCESTKENKKTLAWFKSKGNENFEYDFAASIHEQRYRAHLYTANSGNLCLNMRKIENQIMSLEEIGIDYEFIMDAMRKKSGLLIFCGETGAGKSTTLSAAVEKMQALMLPLHLVTIEDPIEYIYKKTRITKIHQREIGKDTRNYASAIRAAMREKPHIIIVGEIRDSETAEAAMHAAISGHLVIGTLHANSAAEGPRRIVNLFKPDLQPAIRNMLADVFVAFIAQKLAKRKEGGKVLAYEIMNNNNPAISANIKNGAFDALRNDIFSNFEKNRMCLMEQTLANLYQNDIITEAEAYRNANNKDKMKELLKKNSSGASTSATSIGRRL